MDRKEIKELAKEKIKDNKWNILWPMLIISFISGMIGNYFGPKYELVSFDLNNFAYEINVIQVTPLQGLIGGIGAIIIGIAGIAYYRYLLNFVRGEHFEFNDIIETIKKRWVQILLVEILVAVIVFAFSLLLVIPGIIGALAYAMVPYLVVDTDLEAKDVLRKSREMMKGYKWDFFVFGLSFFGWILLVPFTLGILLIWLIPYMFVSMALYYEKLKEING